MKKGLGDYLRKRRSEKKLQEGKNFSLRQVATRIDIEPSYLSKIERGIEAPPSEETTRALAKALGEDPDVLLAMAGKVSSDLQDIIRKRPQLFAQLIRELKNMPDHAMLRLVREVRDGNW
jgi:transcriptional regulator with XRE-family HTH domain